MHGHFELDRAAQTRRIITAMRNPAVRAIAHISGRKIGRRPGIDLEVQAVLAAAEETGTALEINCHLDRLDASAEVLRAARGRGVTFLINTDAHEARELGNTAWGVRHALRGWVDPERVGILDENLGDACRRALGLDRDDCRAFVEDRSWRKSTLQFEGYLSPCTRETAAAQPESSASR